MSRYMVEYRRCGAVADVLIRCEGCPDCQSMLDIKTNRLSARQPICVLDVIMIGVYNYCFATDVFVIIGIDFISCRAFQGSRLISHCKVNAEM